MATQVAALPDDALAGVFHGLPLRSLAVARCVCKAWRDIVDARALLLPHLHLLPRTVRGVFINYLGHDHPHHLARPCSPSTIPQVDGTLSFLPKGLRRLALSVLDHCSGLLLCGETGLSDLCVCNPATRRWTVLPRWWEEEEDDDDKRRRHRYAGVYIVFDPADSSQYEVVLVPTVPKAPSPQDRWSAAEVRRRALLWDEEKHAPFCLDWFFSLPDDGTAASRWEFEQLLPDLPQHDSNDPCRYMEWPPAPWTLRVFSSSTGRWEDRAFVREGSPAGTVEKMRWNQELPYRPYLRYAVYRHGSLYVHCHGPFVTRFCFSKSKYQIIKTPANVNECTRPYLGQLHNGVCFGIIHDHQLKIWILNESCVRMEWVLKYETIVWHYAQNLASITFDYDDRRHDGSWTIEENIEIRDTPYDVNSTLGEEEGHEWDSDNDDTFVVNTRRGQEYFDDYEQFQIIGFHPYKEVVFMVRQYHVVACHLNSTKIQYLGNSCPKYCYLSFYRNKIYESFLYTPCMIGDLPHGDLNW